MNLDYAKALPNFVADETAQRYRQVPGEAELKSYDRIESEVSFQGTRESRQHVVKDGRDWNQPFPAIDGFYWNTGFAVAIGPIFEPRCPTDVEFAERTKVKDVAALVYTFKSPAFGCLGQFDTSFTRAQPPRKGRIVVDEQTGNTLELEETAYDFPQGFNITESYKRTVWGNVVINGATHLLPVASEFLVHFAGGYVWMVKVEYRNHRHFETASSITFQP